MATIRRDSAGISITQNAEPAHPPLRIASVGTGRRTLVGEAIPGQEYVPLNGVVAALRLRDGRVVVADRGQYRVKIFHEDGTLDRGFARRGDGPGELQEVLGVHECGRDTLAVVGRFSVLLFRTDGTFARQVDYRQGGTRSSLLGVSSGCGRLLLHLPANEPALNTTGVVEDVIFWWDPATDAADTIATIGLLEAWTRRLYGSVRPFAVPWGTARTVAPMDNGLILGFGRSPEIRRYGADGDVDMLVRWAAGPERVTADDRARYARLRASWIEGMPPDPEVRFLFPDLDEYPDVAATKPIFARLLRDSRSLWVKHFPSESFGPFDARLPDLTLGPESWSVFDSTGSWMQDIELPERFELLHVSGRFLTGIARDSLDVETVQVLELAVPWAAR